MVVGGAGSTIDYSSGGFIGSFTKSPIFTNPNATPVITPGCQSTHELQQCRSHLRFGRDRIIFTSDRPRNGAAPVVSRNWTNMRKRPR